MKRSLRKGLVAAAGVLAIAGCSSDRLTVQNYLNPTPESIQGDPRAAVPFLVNGILRTLRGTQPTVVLGFGILGREAYNYTPTEGRNTSGWLSNEVNNFGNQNVVRFVDLAPYPASRSFFVGIDLGF